MRSHVMPNPPRAAGLTLLASAFVAGTTLLAKSLGTDALGDPLHPLQISNGRFIFAFIAISSVVLARRVRFENPDLKTHVKRSAFGWLGVSLMFAAAAFIPLSDATAISFLNPVFAMMLAIPLLGEKVGPIRWSAAIIALIGAVILLRPSPDSFQPAALLALAAALALGTEVIFIKRLSGREAPLQILWFNNLFGLGISTLAMLAFWQPPTGAQWLALAALGGLMALAQTCFINAISRADASFVSPFWYATLIFAAFYDFNVYGVVPDWVSVVGALVILSGAALLAWREARLKPSGDTPV
ncbi:DMT family transporter [Pseudoprimorskyibacter insulae]|uniref:Riboflavin transporter n=1 Tax=Pseudoprimorskyibacter insulae TaxID=1695997 RepID=A0A2R8AUU7_9RHOB|nr:DMT family transporter [Pseudoprimorskyibacter insulae]SPF79835.1 Riboflavin transporter [Pseudoprimorskyibacter insulae]